MIEYGVIQTAIDKFQEVAYKKYGSHSYAAGYLSSAMVELMADPTEYQVETTLRYIDRVTRELMESMLLENRN